LKLRTEPLSSQWGMAEQITLTNERRS